MKPAVKLGDEAKDTVTGFKGIAVAITTWLNGCQRITLQPQKVQKDGKVSESATFDIEQIVVLKAAACKAYPPVVEVARPKESGGPMPDVGRRADV